MHPKLPGCGQMVKIFFFSESSNGSYQIKGNGVYGTIQAHYYSVLTHTHDPLVGSKGQNMFFLKNK